MEWWHLLILELLIIFGVIAWIYFFPSAIEECKDMNRRQKKMTKDEMKNRISMALKDPILQQGFEIICKENAELKEKLEHRNCVDCSNHGSKIKLIKAKEIILKLYNAGRDVLMCRAEEKAYDNLSNAINDKSIEQFLKEISE